MGVNVASVCHDREGDMELVEEKEELDISEEVEIFFSFCLFLSRKGVVLGRIIAKKMNYPHNTLAGVCAGFSNVGDELKGQR